VPINQLLEEWKQLQEIASRQNHNRRPRCQILLYHWVRKLAIHIELQLGRYKFLPVTMKC
jgi:hypothetical protein